ncbi:MAG: bifunctional ADP-dependent NAD(P)H-hydrate dehydratase/NAD(P)H-hydrate epimerase, partial [Rubrivivax sp.]|nr:bifunctional ADP-dependent NAD(P)H-hydrate dehydratase/NAD(P)H-hydrate epimerase [Rubrivivax sp.]
GLGGAVALAGRAAARGGAGLVTVAVPDCLADAMEAANLEVMSYPLRDTRDGHVAPGAAAGLVDLLKRSDVVAVGPGLGRS